VGGLSKSHSDKRDAAEGEEGEPRNAGGGEQESTLTDLNLLLGGYQSKKLGLSNRERRKEGLNAQNKDGVIQKCKKWKEGRKKQEKRTGTEGGLAGKRGHIFGGIKGVEFINYEPPDWEIYASIFRWVTGKRRRRGSPKSGV